MTVSDSKTDNYSYDAIDQVTSVGYGTGRNVGYNYDAVGNRMTVSDSVSGTTSYTTNSLNQYTNIAALVPSYDGNGNLTSINGWTYAYDAQNRLLTASSGTNSESFAYDAQNRCVSRTLNGTTTYFFYDGWSLIEELDGSGNELASYVSGAKVDELLYKATPAGTVFYHHDGLGSTTALTDANGNLVERYTYDVFGTPTILSANNNQLSTSAYGNRFLFTGREYLQEVGLYDYRNRVYSAELGRFLQTDPMRFSANDVNVYRYVGNDAVNKEDKLGLNSNAGRIEAQADIQERTQPDLNNPIPANAAEAAGGAAQSAMDWLGDYLHEKYLHQAMQDCEKVAHSASGKCKCCIIYLTYKLMGSDLEEIYDGGYGKVKNTPCSEAHPEDSFEAPGENRTTDKYTW